MDQPSNAGQLVSSIPPQPRKKPEPPKPERHRWFDPWMIAKGRAAKALVQATHGLIQHYEKHISARTRRRRPIDEALHRKRVEAFICNLARAVLMPPPTGRIAIKLGNGRKGRSRYESPIMGKPLPPLIDMLEDLDFLDKRWPMIRGEVSSVAPSPWFAQKVAEFGVQLSDFGRDDDEEVIRLTRKTRWRDGSSHREEIDYADTCATYADREAIRALNAFLRKANIAFIDDGRTPRVDPYDRTMRRHYVIGEGQEVRFDQSGRLFGGFWQNLKSNRRRNIRIDGEEVAILDYGSMFTRLAYAAVGAVPPEGDLYVIPGLEGYRSGVKMAMNTFLFDKAPRRSWPNDMGMGAGDDSEVYGDPYGDAVRLEGRLPKGWTVKRLKQAVLKVHPVLKNAWGRQLGFTLMHRESEIILAVLLELASRGIPALGLHDGLIVARRYQGIAEEVMIQKGRKMAGIPLPVTCKLA
jgi:hypothetical protein